MGRSHFLGRERNTFRSVSQFTASVNLYIGKLVAVADLGEGPGGAGPPPLILGKKND